MSPRAPSADAIGAPPDRNAFPAKDDAEAPTVPLAPRDRKEEPGAHRPSRAARPRRDAPIVEGSVIEAMHVEEAERACGFGRALMILCITRLALDPLITPTAPWLRITAAAALAVMGAVSGWVWWRARDPARYSRRVFRIFGCSAVAAGTVFLFHGGVFSPMPLLITLGIPPPSARRAAASSIEGGASAEERSFLKRPGRGRAWKGRSRRLSGADAPRS